MPLKAYGEGNKTVFTIKVRLSWTDDNIKLDSFVYSEMERVIVFTEQITNLSTFWNLTDITESNTRSERGLILRWIRRPAQTHRGSYAGGLWRIRNFLFLFGSENNCSECETIIQALSLICQFQIELLSYTGTPCLKVEVLGCHRLACADVNECKCVLHYSKSSNLI